MNSFGERLKLARDHAKISQSELARRAPPLKAQAIQHLENPKKKAQGSKYTLALARACGVDPDWLASGKGTMLHALAGRAAEHVAAYEAISVDAQQIAIAWSELSPDRREFFRELIFIEASLEKRAPWMRRGRPKNETYDAWEKRQEQNFAALVSMVASRLKG